MNSGIVSTNNAMSIRHGLSLSETRKNPAFIGFGQYAGQA